MLCLVALLIVSYLFCQRHRSPSSGKRKEEGTETVIGLLRYSNSRSVFAIVIVVVLLGCLVKVICVIVGLAYLLLGRDRDE